MLLAERLAFVPKILNSDGLKKTLVIVIDKDVLFDIFATKIALPVEDIASVIDIDIIIEIAVPRALTTIVLKIEIALDVLFF